MTPTHEPLPAAGVWKLRGLLVAVVFLLYAPAVRFHFINYDDPLYLNLNEPVMAGIPAGLKAMWTTFSYGNWQPLTLMSHALDVQLFGLNAGPHHAVSILLHALNSLLVFAFLERWSGRRNVSFLAALLWAIHPISIDAVAWISQRKTLLSACFGLLAALRYLDYRSRPSAGRAAQVLLFFLLGLLSKGVLVTLPLVLVWATDLAPSSPATRPTVRDHWLAPSLFELGILFGLLVMVGQKSSNSVVQLDLFPLPSRIGYAFDNYIHYLVKLAAPFRLAIHYPTPEAPLPPLRYAAVAAAVLGLSALAWQQRTARPWLSTGWFWFLLLLAPLCGILATGQAIKTDRFAYLPSIGICLIAAEAAARLMAQWKPTRWVVLLALALLALRARDQLSVWKDSETVYLHALSVTAESALVRNNLAVHYIANDRMEEAAVNLVEALRQLSTDPFSWANLQLVLTSPQGQRALEFHLREVEATRPDDPHYRLVRFQIALVRAREAEARSLWTQIMGDPAADARIQQRAREFLAEYEGRFGPLFEKD